MPAGGVGTPDGGVGAGLIGLASAEARKRDRGSQVQCISGWLLTLCWLLLRYWFLVLSAVGLVHIHAGFMYTRSEEGRSPSQCSGLRRDWHECVVMDVDVDAVVISRLCPGVQGD